MRRVMVMLVGVVVLAVAGAGGAASSTARAGAPTVLAFETMAPVSGVFVGHDQIRGVPGGGIPWVISSGRGELKADGSLEVQVTGLVLDPAFVPAPLGGTNPIPNFEAIVSCLQSDGTTANVSTGPFPASSAGNSEIEATVSLPARCFAPIIFVAAGSVFTGRWFAVTGQ